MAMIESLRKAAARLLRNPTDRHGYPTDRPARHTALDDVPTLAQVYPGVAAVTLELRALSPDRDYVSLTHTRRFGPEARASFAFRCKNPDCHGGGFDLAGLIDGAIAGRTAQRSGREVCEGAESPRGTYLRRCMHELNYRIRIDYRGN